ncbi:MAG: alpha/beta fold hydrolase [Nitrospirae bacterium]|nr:alpha/beta fold hydrolase [Nitrospirota bacterium]
MPERLYPFRHRFRSIRGIRVHYVDEGEGPPILFLHGNPTWSFVYRDIIRGLRGRGFRCVALDYPGFGMSEKPPHYGYTPLEQARVVEGLVQNLDLKNITLFVHDWGGPIGLWVAGRHPERIRRLAIGNTWAWPVPGHPRARRWIAFISGPVGRFLVTRLNFMINVLLRSGSVRHRERFSPEVMAAYRSPFSRPQDRAPMHIFPAQIFAAEAFLTETEAGLASLAEKPVLILWGERDVAFKEEELARWMKIFPAASLQRFPRAGHFLQEDVPDEIVERIAAWG